MSLSTIFYIFSICVVFCVSFKLRERLNLYIESIPEKERNYCHQFLHNNMVQLILACGMAFALLKFVVDPAILILFPATITVGGSVSQSNPEELNKPFVDVIYEETDKQQGGNPDENLDKEIKINQQQQQELIQKLQQVQKQIEQQQNTQKQSLAQTVQAQMEQKFNNTTPKIDNTTENTPENVNAIEKTTENVNIIEETTENVNAIEETTENVNAIEKTTENVNEIEETTENVNAIENTYENQPKFPENSITSSDYTLQEKETGLEGQSGGKKMGRPKKLKSQAKVALGKKNVWAQAVKQARKALNIEGFQAVKKGSLLYKTAQAYYTTLKNN